jgi:hypothetical protein
MAHRLHHAAGLVAFCIAASGSPLAAAKPSFPISITQALGLGYEPPCSVCHVKGNTGNGTASTPFALSLRARGLTGEGRNVLAAPLAALEADQVDSDGDGVIDVTELRDATDPNSPANASLVGNPDPGYGCGGSPPSGNRRGASPLAGLGVFGALARRWRRRGGSRR